MNIPFSYSHKFILDKAHFNECYSQSVSEVPFFRAYLKAIILSVFGMALVLLSDVNDYAAWFVFALGILEAVSIYYKQAWWVMRQLLGKASKSEVTLTIDDKGISTESFYVKNMVLWSNINAFKKTPLGWVVTHEQGDNYISDSCLSEESQALFKEYQTRKNIT